jgi:hypothetical protein
MARQSRISLPKTDRTGVALRERRIHPSDQEADGEAGWIPVLQLGLPLFDDWRGGEPPFTTLGKPNTALNGKDLPRRRVFY